jgi:hypothetical protein
MYLYLSDNFKIKYIIFFSGNGDYLVFFCEQVSYTIQHEHFLVKISDSTGFI